MEEVSVDVRLTKISFTKPCSTDNIFTRNRGITGGSTTSAGSFAQNGIFQIRYKKSWIVDFMAMTKMNWETSKGILLSLLKRIERSFQWCMAEKDSVHKTMSTCTRNSGFNLQPNSTRSILHVYLPHCPKPVLFHFKHWTKSIWLNANISCTAKISAWKTQL